MSIRDMEKKKSVKNKILNLKYECSPWYAAKYSSLTTLKYHSK